MLHCALAPSLFFASNIWLVQVFIILLASFAVLRKEEFYTV